MGLNNDDDNAVPFRRQVLQTIKNYPPKTVNTGAAVQVLAASTIQRAIFRNASETATVALGGSSVTLENAAIVLLPGDSWVEEDAAGAAWYATSSDAGATVCVMGVER
ncbi:MAG TPA: hypothetical protein DDX04_12120 [Massilia sp.]|nr:hypothetical protein [Massilia sp.]